MAGAVLYMMWGVYHGLLMVFHRQWQEFRKRVGFEWTGLIPSLISWAITFSAVCIGYIFFNARNVPQAMHMLKAVASLRSYRHITLDHSFCLMTMVASVGYFAVLGGSILLDRLAERAQEGQGWLAHRFRWTHRHRALGLDHAHRGNSGALSKRNVPAWARRNRAGHVRAVLAPGPHCDHGHSRQLH